MILDLKYGSFSWSVFDLQNCYTKPIFSWSSILFCTHSNSVDSWFWQDQVISTVFEMWYFLLFFFLCCFNTPVVWHLISCTAFWQELNLTTNQTIVLHGTLTFLFDLDLPWACLCYTHIYNYIVVKLIL